MEVCQEASLPSSLNFFAQSAGAAMTTVTVAITGPIDPYRFNMFMSDLLAERGSDIKQMHGILSVQGYGSQATHFKFQGAQQTVRFGPAVGRSSEIAHQCVSQVTFSGKNLSEEDLQEAFDSCAWLPVAPGWTEHFVPGYQQPFYVHQATGRKQWRRPAAVECQQAVPVHQTASATLTVVSQDSAQLLDRPSSQASGVCTQTRSIAAVSKRGQSGRSEARSAVSCPCDASDACAAVFDIKGRPGLRTAKRARDEDVTSKLADLELREDCMALFDSASEYEMHQTASENNAHKRKLTSPQQLRQSMQHAREGLRRSHSCQWTSKEPIKPDAQVAAVK